MAEHIIFENRPDMEYIMQVLCELLNKQDVGEYEYTYKISPKEDEKNVKRRDR